MLAEVETRLETGAMPPLKLVDGAMGFAGVNERPPPREKQPAAYVIPLGDNADPNKIVNAVRQVAHSRIGVVYALSNLGDARGEGATKALEAVLNAARSVLVGWSPGGGYGVFTFERGRPIVFRGGILWWQDELRADFVISG